VQPALATFVQSFDLRMDSSMFTSPITVDYFDLQEAEPRVPFASQDIVAGYGSGTCLPLDVSMCLSFSGNVVSGGNRARRRGRIYLPTFLSTMLEEGGNRVRWTAAARTEIALAASTFADTIESGGTDSRWAVFSPTTVAEGGSLQDAMTAVREGWVDDEPDTQRRRGTKSSERTVWVVL